MVALFVVALLVQFAPTVLATISDTVRPDSTIGTYLPGSATTDFKGFVSELIIKVLLPVAATIAVLFIIIGGYQYIFSGANEELAETGKKTLQNAIIGLIIIILSYVIINVIISIIGNSTT